MRRLLAAMLLLCGCSGKLGIEPAPLVKMVGMPPDTSGLPRINKGPATGASLKGGIDGKPWAAFREGDHAVRVVNLEDPNIEQLFSATRLYPNSSYWFFFLVNEPKDAIPGMTPAEMTIHVPGETEAQAAAAAVYPVKAGSGFLMVSNSGQFLYWVLSPLTATFQVFRFNDPEPLSFPVLPGVVVTNPTGLGQFQFSPNGKLLLTRDGNGDLVVHHLDKSAMQPDDDLGVTPKQFFFKTVGGDSKKEENNRTLVLCGEGGLRYFSLKGEPDVVLDPDCDEHNSVNGRGDLFIYSAKGELRSVPKDGSAPYSVIETHGTHLLDFVPGTTTPIYSRINEDTFFAGVGTISDGWIGAQKFMERGRSVAFSKDRQRLLWLDRAATLNGAGDLMMAPIDDELHIGTASRLLANCTFFTFLDNRRLLVWDDDAFYGAQSRLIVVDLDTLLGTWLVRGIEGFQFISYPNDLMVNLITGPRRYDIVRMQVPKAPPPPE